MGLFLSRLRNSKARCPIQFFTKVHRCLPVIDNILRFLSNEDLQCLSLTSPEAEHECLRVLGIREKKILDRFSSGATNPDPWEGLKISTNTNKGKIVFPVQDSTRAVIIELGAGGLSREPRISLFDLTAGGRQDGSRLKPEKVIEIVEVGEGPSQLVGQSGNQNLLALAWYTPKPLHNGYEPGSVGWYVFND